MQKALLSFGIGDAAKMLALARPTFETYARRHGYDLLISDSVDLGGRPASWGKIRLLQQALDRYDFALWLDADAIIVDGNVDIESVIPADAYQAFVTMDIGPGGAWGRSPCCGVWALRAGERTERFLSEVWAQDLLSLHMWWEQAAVMRLLGWRIDGFPVCKQHRTDWDEGLFELPGEWDVIPAYPWPAEPPRILHYGGESTWRRLVELGTELARLEDRRVRYSLGLLHRRMRRFPRATAALDAILA